MKQKQFLLGMTLLAATKLACAAPGFIVAAPDRGFTGNEVVRDAVSTLRDEYSTELVFVTEEGTSARLDQAYLSLAESEPVVVLPLYLTRAHPDRELLHAWLNQNNAIMARPFGHSASALAYLERRLRTIEQPAQTRLVLMGHGAETDSQAKAMEEALRRMLDAAGKGLRFASTAVEVWTDVAEFEPKDYQQELDALAQAQGKRTLVVPFHLGAHLDSMMGFTPRMRNAAPDGVTVAAATDNMEQALIQWLQREAARYAPLDTERLGIVIHAHGSNWRWNETMRQGGAPLNDDYLVEYAFSMGDPATLRHAVRHLEERGAQAIVIVRVFGMENSFKKGITRFIGQAWENCDAIESAGHHHGHGGSNEPAALLQTQLPVITVGGLEDHPLYAKALYQRTLALSEQPSKETVIVVAHGLGNKEGNAHWRQTLESIRNQMLRMGGDQFRAIKVGLWSEDWPELRQDAVEHIRSMVSEANQSGGRALIVPARTLGQGHADKYLDGLEYRLGEGFAPHPLFAEWLHSQVELGVGQLQYDASSNWQCPN